MYSILKNKIVAVALALVVIVSTMIMAVPAFAAGYTMNISTTVASVANGATFTVNINAVDVSAIRAFGTNVNFDPAKLTAVSVAQGTFLSDWAAANGATVGVAMASSINNVTGQVKDISYYLQGGAGGPTGSGVLATVTFQAKANVNATTDITLASALYTDVAIVDQTASTTGLTMTIGTVPQPDLSITGLVANGTSADYTVSFRVNNIGTLAAPASSASVAVDGGTPVVLPVAAIAIGAYVDVTSAPITINGQNDDIVVTVDSASSIIELNEANNFASTAYAYVPPPPGQTTDVNGTIIRTLTFTQPAAINFGAMTLGNNHQEGNLNVKTNASWQITTASDIADGKMTKYNGTSYTAAVKLHNALRVKTTLGYLGTMPEQTDPANYEITLNGTPTLMANGVTDGQITDTDGTTNLGEDRILNYNQTVIAADTNLPSGYTYHIVVSFQASNTNY